MTPEHMISYYSKLKPFRNMLKEIQLTVSKNVESDYSIWGDKIFIPILIYQKIVNKHMFEHFIHTAAQIFPHIIWNFCRSVYRFDNKIFNLVLSSAAYTIPMSIFFHLKEWALCIDLRKKGLTLNGKEITYSILCLSDVNNNVADNKEPCLLISLGMKTNDNRTTYSYVVPMISDNLEECIAEADKIRTEIEEHVNTKPEKNYSHRMDVLSKIINLYLYILCENSTIVNKNLSSISYHDKKRSKNIFCPLNIKTWLIKDPIDKDKGHKNIKKTSIHMKPHIRRGHFHGYWLGPRDKPTDIVIKWIPPIYINSHEIDSIRLV